jgi:sugar phosphate isomerase/epimerase
MTGDTSMPRIPISIQHFSVKNSYIDNPEGTLASVKDIGYDAFEFFGPFSMDAGELDAVLKNHGLFCSGWHVQTEDLFEDKIDATIEYNLRIGNKMLIMPHLPDHMIEDYATIAGPTRDFFYSVTEKLNSFGIDTGLHNHYREFEKLPDADCSIWEAVRDNTPANFIMQFDTGNCMGGGFDPITEIYKVENRVKCLHLKPFSRTTGANATIGHDDIDLDTILSFARQKGGTEIVVIEYEGTDDEIENARLCFNGLIEKYSKYLY